VILLPLALVYRQRSRINDSERQRRPISLRVPATFTLSALYVLGGILLWKPVWESISESLNSMVLILGSLLYFPGIALYLWGFFTLGKMFAVSSSRAAALYPDQVLIESGPYHYLRHPMYMGVILAALGAALIFRTWAMVLYSLTALSVLLRARREDELLAVHFGARWEEYRARVPGWLPRLRRPGSNSLHGAGDE